ncbi:MAG: hypothetical protein ALAOOOJD_01764 [bacterium]|nr:hypothetical protein [bacterium]
MKRRIFLLAALVATFSFSAVMNAAEMQHQRMKLNFWGSGLSSVGGSFSSSLKTSDAVKTGASYGLAWQYFPWRSFGVQAGYEFGGMHFKAPSAPGETPAFVIHQITVAGIYNFANAIGSSARLRPLINAGVGLYPFRINVDGFSGAAAKLSNGNEFTKTSFGLNAGAGVEFAATNRFSIYGGARYQYLFAKDEQKFGADAGFGDQRILNYGLGLMYNFSLQP